MGKKRLEQNLMLLENVSVLQLKSMYVEKVEKYCVEQLLREYRDFGFEAEEAPLIVYLRSLIKRRKLSQVSIAMCVKVIDRHYSVLTV